MSLELTNKNDFVMSRDRVELQENRIKKKFRKDDDTDEDVRTAAPGGRFSRLEMGSSAVSRIIEIE